MFTVRVTITDFLAEDPQPGIVSCLLTDRFGRSWRFVDKAAIFYEEHLWWDSGYPRPGQIACRIISRGEDERGRATAMIDTMTPWCIETEDGVATFDVFIDQLAEIPIARSTA